jgi:hypothetical protein
MIMQISIAAFPTAYQSYLIAADQDTANGGNQNAALDPGAEIDVAKAQMPPGLAVLFDQYLQRSQNLPTSYHGRYAEPVADLIEYFEDNPDATQSFVVGEETTRALFHINPNTDFSLANSLRNGQATTSESQALFFLFAVNYACLSGNTQLMEQSYNYVRYFMQPGDGWESPQLPDRQLAASADFPPGLMHWAVDVTGRGRGPAVFGENICYDIYQTAAPAIATYPNTHTVAFDRSHKTGDNNAFVFSSAPDADLLWMEGLATASLAGIADWADDYQRTASSGLNTTVSSDSSVSATPFSIVWGKGAGSDGAAWTHVDSIFYSGYQDPAAWILVGQTDNAKGTVAFLKAAQDEYVNRYASFWKNNAGPFMPVFKEGEFGWEGPDPKTDLCLFQYRTFANLAHYYYLTGDQTARDMLDKFYQWVKSVGSIAEGNIDLPARLYANTPLSGTYLGVREINFSSPENAALLAEGISFMAARSGDTKLKTEAEYLLDDLARQGKKAREADKPGLYDSNPIIDLPKKSTLPTEYSQIYYGWVQATVANAYVTYDFLFPQ